MTLRIPVPDSQFAAFQGLLPEPSFSDEPAAPDHTASSATGFTGLAPNTSGDYHQQAGEAPSLEARSVFTLTAKAA